MRHTALWTSVIATSFGLALAAQTPTGSQTSSSPTTDKSRSAKTVTMTGCVERGDRAGEFKLTNIDKSGTPGTAGTSGSMSGTGTTGSGSGTTGSGTSGSATSGTSDWSDSSTKEFKLKAKGAAVRLDQHVGQKVEVTGSVDASASSMSSTGSRTGSGTGTMPGGTPGSGTTGTSGTAGSPGSTSAHDMNAKTIEVTSLRMVSSTCR